MKRTIKVVLTLAVLIVPALLFAQSGAAPDLYAGADKMKMEADRKLRAACEKLVKSMQDEGRSDADGGIERFRESQNAWLKYREAQVAFVAQHAEIGSSSARAAGMVAYYVELTERRIKDVEEVPNPF